MILIAFFKNIFNPLPFVTFNLTCRDKWVWKLLIDYINWEEKFTLFIITRDRFTRREKINKILRARWFLVLSKSRKIQTVIIIIIIIKVGEEIVYGRSNSSPVRNWGKKKKLRPRLRRLNLPIMQVPRSCGKYIRKFERKPKKEKLGSPDTKGTSIIRNGVRGLRVSSSSNKMYLPTYPSTLIIGNRIIETRSQII